MTMPATPHLHVVSLPAPLVRSLADRLFKRSRGEKGFERGRLIAVVSWLTTRNGFDDDRTEKIELYADIELWDYIRKLCRSIGMPVICEQIAMQLQEGGD